MSFNKGKPAEPEAIEDEAAGEDLATQVAALQATVQALLAQKAGGIGEDKLEAILLRVAQMSADAQERAANPSNKTHPGMSVYSYPEGDRARPRPPFKCPMYWNGYDLTPDTTTAEEIELLNLAEPGIYRFLRTDKSPETLRVVGDRDPAGALSRLLFTFPTKENRDTLPSMAALLRDAFQIKSPEQLELEALRRQVAALQPAGASA
jgi:hypothetical protein